MSGSRAAASELCCGSCPRCRDRSPDGAKRNPGILSAARPFPDCASLHPGYKSEQGLEKSSMHCRIQYQVFALCIGLLTASHAAAQTPEQFYKGKAITVLVGTSPGGINDITARFAAKHLSHFIPGNPLVNVQYTPGGGGLVTANRIYNTA